VYLTHVQINYPLKAYCTVTHVEENSNVLRLIQMR